MSAPGGNLFSAAAAAQAEKLGLRMGRANLEAFAETLLELARSDRRVLAVTSDSRGSGKLKPFRRSPARADCRGRHRRAEPGWHRSRARLAGKKVFAVSPGVLSHGPRTRTDQERRLLFRYAGHAGRHQRGRQLRRARQYPPSLHDLAALRAIHNITILAPADNRETRSAVRWAAAHAGPVYLRFGKASMFDLSSAPAPDDPRVATLLPTGPRHRPDRLRRNGDPLPVGGGLPRRGGDLCPRDQC
jgi:transketolase